MLSSLEPLARNATAGLQANSRLTSGGAARFARSLSPSPPRRQGMWVPVSPHPDPQPPRFPFSIPAILGGHGEPWLAREPQGPGAQARRCEGGLTRWAAASGACTGRSSPPSFLPPGCTRSLREGDRHRPWLWLPAQVGKPLSNPPGRHRFSPKVMETHGRNFQTTCPTSPTAGKDAPAILLREGCGGSF